MYSKIVTVLFALVSISFGQEIFPGACPEVIPVDNFEFTRFLGNWYEIQRYQIQTTPGSECVQDVFSQWNDTTIAVDVTGKNLLTNLTEAYHGRMQEEFPGENVGIVSVVIDDVDIEEILYFLALDYEAFSLSWACFYVEEADVNAQLLWVHARQSQITEEQETIIKDTITRNGLNGTLLYNTIQDSELCAT